MIIECQTCHARFRLDESKIRGRGARVKCRKCGDSILVLKESAAAPPAPVVDGSFDLGSAVRDSAGERAVSAPPAGNLILFPGSGRPEEPAAPEASGPDGDEPVPAFDRILSAGAETPSPSAGETAEEAPAPPEAGVPAESDAPAALEPRPELDLGGLTLDLGSEEKLDLPPALDLEQPFGEPTGAEPSPELHGEGGFLMSDSDALVFLREKDREAGPEAPPGVGDISLEISSTPTGGEGDFLRQPEAPPEPREDRAAAPEETFLEGNVTPPSAPAVDAPPYREEEPSPALRAESPARREFPERPGSAAPGFARPRSSAGLAAAAVAAVLLAAGGYLGLTTPGKRLLERTVPAVAALWGGKPAPAAAKYDLRNVIGYYESGSASPRILVIKGQVANLSKGEKSGIRVQATLLDNADAVLAQQSVYAGNTLSGEAIRKGNRDALTKTLGNRFGEGLSNLNVAPGKAIPFIVLFFDAPENMDGYRLEAKDAE